MIGTVVNAIAIVVGSLVGLLFRKGIPEKVNQTVIHAVGLAVILIGIKGALRTENVLLVIGSLVVGGVVGELAGIERGLEALGHWIGRRFGSTTDDGVARGFVTASLVFCVGAMAIVGSLESGLTGNHQTLFAKSVLDGVTSILFTASLGAGVIFSALPVALYQGTITLAAGAVKPLLTPEVIAQLSSVGGLLIVAIGTNLLGMTRIRIGNLLPAIIVPFLYALVRRFFF
ncbi:MAG: DUF554 domain-containing protein [Desulfobacterales bacterium]